MELNSMFGLLSTHTIVWAAAIYIFSGLCSLILATLFSKLKETPNIQIIWAVFILFWSILVYILGQTI